VPNRRPTGVPNRRGPTDVSQPTCPNRWGQPVGPTGGQRARSCSKATPPFTPQAWRVPAQGNALGKDPENNSCALQGRSSVSLLYVAIVG